MIVARGQGSAPAHRATGTKPDREPGARWLVAILTGGLVVRLALAPFGKYVYDVDKHSAWALALAESGPADFYTATESDHLPGDLWLIWLVGLGFRALSPGGDVGDPLLEFLIKLVPILADVAVAALLYAIGRHLAGTRAGLVAAGLYAFNPAPIFISSVWGQWDSVSAALLLLGVLCLLWGRVTAALPALTLAALIKPQLAVVGGVALLAFILSRERRAIPWRGIALGGSLSLLLLVAVTAPFQTPPWPTDHDLYDQAQVALKSREDPTASAFNLWSFWEEPVEEGGSDLRSFALGADYRVWGIALFGLVMLAALVSLVKRPDGRHMLWACCVVALALFALLTRMHERYLLPAVALAAVLAAIERRYLGVAAVLSLSLFANLYWVYDYAYGLPSVPLLTGSAAITIVAVLNLSVLTALLVFPPREGRSADHGFGSNYPAPMRRGLRA